MEIVSQDVDQRLLGWCHEWCPLLSKIPGPLVAGGFIRDFFINSYPSDMDLYFRNEDCFKMAKEVIESSGLYDLVIDTDRAITYQRKPDENFKGKRPIQLIKYLYGQPQKILGDFDFIMSMGGVDILTKKLYLHPKFMEDLIQRKLTYNPETTPFRLSTLKRVVKFVSRGFHIDDSDLVAIAKRINNMTKAKMKGYEERNGDDPNPNPEAYLDYV